MSCETNFMKENFKQFDHFAIVNKSPICKYHSLIVPFLHDKLPQKMDSDALAAVLRIMDFFQSSSKTLRIGFNSLGGYSSINHLHFHLVFVNELFHETKAFPIESAPNKLMASFNLQIPFQDKQNLQIDIYIIEEYPIRCLMIKTIDEINEESLINLMGDTVAIILSLLCEENIAHNMMIAEKGKVFYIIPRQNEAVNERKMDFNCAWLELCGLAICKNEEIFSKINYQDYYQFLRENIGYDELFFERWMQKINNYFKDYCGLI